MQRGGFEVRVAARRMQLATKKTQSAHAAGMIQMRHSIAARRRSSYVVPRMPCSTAVAGAALQPGRDAPAAWKHIASHRAVALS